MTTTLLVVGASLAGIRAAESARRLGFAGSIVIVGDEPTVTCDRPQLTKSYLEPGANEEAPPLRSRAQLDALGADVRTGVSACALDPDRRIVETSQGPIPYDGLIVATGSRPRIVPGLEPGERVLTLRTSADASRLRLAMDAATSVTIVGSGFIGGEVASAAAARGMRVTVVEAAKQPLARALGAEVGSALSVVHARRGTELRLGMTVERLTEQADHIDLSLSDGTTLRSDLVVVGTGNVPNVEWLESSGIALSDGVACEPDLSLMEFPTIAAAGDVCRWTDARWGRSTRTEHWTNASEQGAHASRTVLSHLAGDQSVPFTTVPFFWSHLYDVNIQLVGRSDGTDVEILGDTRSGLIALYRQGDALWGALSAGTQPQTAPFRSLLGVEGTWDSAVLLAHELLNR